MRVILEIVAGPFAKKKITVGGHQKVTFGRTQWADFSFPADTLMSSKHFSVECDGQICLVHDLNSTNGTYVNDERVIEAPVPSGALIRAGHTLLKVTLEDVEAAAPQRQTWAGNQGGSNQLVTAPGAPLLFLASQFGEADASRPYDEALNDPDPKVRRAALLTAAWSGRKWVLEYCRRLSAPPLLENWETLLLLGILGQPADVERILAIGRTAELGPKRFEILGAFGNPKIVKDLLIGIESKNPVTAISAGAAFTKITGADISSDRRAAIAPEGPSADEFDQEFAEEATLPSPELAAKYWKEHQNHYAKGGRWCRGLDLSRGLPDGALESLNFESRWEACLRGRFEGTWQKTALDLEQLAAKLSQ